MNRINRLKRLKKILILGGNGFIGKNIKNKSNSLNYVYLERKDVDFLNINELNKFFKDINPEIVINCSGSVGSYLKNTNIDEFEIFHNNIIINMNILKCCKENNIETLISFSSYRTFGDNIPENYDETYLTHNLDIINNAGYLSSKIVNDFQYILFNKNVQKLRIVCFILPNLYGFYDDFSDNARIIPSLIYKFVKAKENNENIYIDTHPDMEYNLLDVNDLVKIIQIEINMGFNYKGNNVIVFNKQNIIKIKDICDIIKNKISFTNNIIFNDKKELPITNIMKPNTEKFDYFFTQQQYFKFTELEKSINNTIDHYILTKGIS